MPRCTIPLPYITIEDLLNLVGNFGNRLQLLFPLSDTLSYRLLCLLSVDMIYLIDKSSGAFGTTDGLERARRYKLLPAFGVPALLRLNSLHSEYPHQNISTLAH